YADSGINKESILEKIRNYEKQEENLDKRIADLSLQLTQRVDRPLLIQDVEYFCEVAQGKIKDFSLEERRRFLTYLINKITVDSIKKKVIITGYIPLTQAQEGPTNLTEVLSNQYNRLGGYVCGSPSQPYGGVLSPQC
ncbi:MAG: hypothetical protein PHN36_04205, partial [Patescibacteria group bacterium]|nr:hypothetical protein [Patescibacteria group bacterium]